MKLLGKALLVDHLFEHVDHVVVLSVDIANDDARLGHLDKVGLRIYTQQHSLCKLSQADLRKI